MSWCSGVNAFPFPFLFSSSWGSFFPSFCLFCSIPGTYSVGVATPNWTQLSPLISSAPSLDLCLPPLAFTASPIAFSGAVLGLVLLLISKCMKFYLTYIQFFCVYSQLPPCPQDQLTICVDLVPTHYSHSLVPPKDTTSSHITSSRHTAITTPR